MSMQDMKKKARTKKGLTYLGVGVIILIASFAMYALNLRGAIAGLVNLAMVGCFAVGLIYLILGFIGKG